MNLGVKAGRLKLDSPLVGASGLFGYGTEHDGLLDYASIGAIVTKTITPAPREGNPPPRLVDVGSGIINSIGLENVGADAFMAEHLPGLDLPCKVFVSIGGAIDVRNLFRTLREQHAQQQAEADQDAGK